MFGFATPMFNVFWLSFCSVIVRFLCKVCCFISREDDVKILIDLLNSCSFLVLLLLPFHSLPWTRASYVYLFCDFGVAPSCVLGRHIYFYPVTCSHFAGLQSTTFSNGYMDNFCFLLIL